MHLSHSPEFSNTGKSCSARQLLYVFKLIYFKYVINGVVYVVIAEL